MYESQKRAVEHLLNALGQRPDKWRDAILDELASCCMDAPQTEEPASILKRIIEWHTMVALDPEVSQEARGLIEAGRKLERTREIDWGAVDEELRTILYTHTNCHISDRAMSELRALLRKVSCQ
jgi:hypothetical protein